MPVEMTAPEANSVFDDLDARLKVLRRESEARVAAERSLPQEARDRRRSNLLEAWAEQIAATVQREPGKG